MLASIRTQTTDLAVIRTGIIIEAWIMVAHFIVNVLLSPVTHLVVYFTHIPNGLIVKCWTESILYVAIFSRSTYMCTCMYQIVTDFGKPDHRAFLTVTEGSPISNMI